MHDLGGAVLFLCALSSALALFGSDASHKQKANYECETRSSEKECETNQGHRQGCVWDTVHKNCLPR